MGSLERSKKKVQLWRKAVVHFALCFVMGFFIGFAPSSKGSFFFNRAATSNKLQFSPPPLEMLHRAVTPRVINNVNRSLIAPLPPRKRSEESKRQMLLKKEDFKQPSMAPRRLIIIVTPTVDKDRYRGVFLRRLANTIRLIAPPLLWIVVEKKQSDSSEVSEILRKTGILYRHLVFKENFTDTEAELDHQRNVALRHIEHHRLSGIVHFAGLSNVYDLRFFDELREIEVFGTWAMAILSANKNKVKIEGPVCDSSQVLGWHLMKMNNETDTNPPPIHVSSLGFNSSILWDPERWGRPSSGQQTSQESKGNMQTVRNLFRVLGRTLCFNACFSFHPLKNSIKFVKEVALEDETKLKGIPSEDCSKIMLWRLQFPNRKT